MPEEPKLPLGNTPFEELLIEVGGLPAPKRKCAGELLRVMVFSPCTCVPTSCNGGSDVDLRGLLANRDIGFVEGKGFTNGAREECAAAMIAFGFAVPGIGSMSPKPSA